MAKLPVWADQMKGKYEAGTGQVFLLHGNTADYVNGSRHDVRSYLELIFSNRLVVFYNRAEGFSFGVGGKAARDRFVELVGLSGAGSDLAALAQITGGSNTPQEIPLPRDPSAAFPLIDRLMKADKGNVRAAVVIDHLETIAGAADVATMSPEDRTNLVQLQLWARRAEVIEQEHAMVMVTSALGEIAHAVRAASSRIVCIEVPMPTAAEREAFATGLQMEYADGMDSATLARMTAGLNRVHIEDIALQALYEHVPVTAEMIKRRKREIVSSEFDDVLELIDPKISFEDIGGHEHVKQFFSRNIINPIRNGNTRRVPQGVLMLGPAGTGKSVMAEAVAAEANVNCVRLNPARIFGAYVGQSERNLEKALKCLEEMTPVIVFIDEIDQTVQRSSGQHDSGVGARVFKRLLEFMADGSHRGKVVFLAASNRPDMIDAGLKRPGRFDKKIPFLAPDLADRRAIVRVMAKRYNAPCDDTVADAVAKATEGWTGAELEALAVKATELIEDESLTPGDAFKSAISRYRPTTADIELMTLLAIAEVNDTDLLPEKYRVKLGDRAKLDAEIAERKERTGRGARSI